MYPLTTWVKRLLIANIAVFFLSQAAPVIQDYLILYPPRLLRYPYYPWTLVTYMFLHAGLAHIFFNMLGLFFFGPRLESRLGERPFLWLYFLSGIGGAVFSFFFARRYPVVGASAAVYGVLLGFAMYWPRERIYIWGILPVEAWLLATILIGASLWSGMNPGTSRTAHFAHLGGIAFGFAYIKWHEWRKGAPSRAFQQKARGGRASPSGMVGDRIAVARWRGISLERLHELNREEVERLLAKVKDEGVSSLSTAERDFLDRMSAA